MKTLKVGIPGREYDIIIGNGVMTHAGEHLAPLFSTGKAAVISDENIWPLYGGTLTESLARSGFSPFPIILPAGEMTKSMQMLERIYNALLEGGLTRNEPVIALGGGVIGDIAGFAAATFMRGVPFVQIPTTLLAQVDSSVGGKVAVNLSGGKNMAGAFYQPKMVITDTSTLTTLPDREFASGMAEVIKYAAIADRGLIGTLSVTSGRDAVMDMIGEIIYVCCDIKREVVLDDELDRGGRQILNFGHTFGHALEKLGNYTKYTHGEAVAAGMVLAAKTGEALGISEQGVNVWLSGALDRFRLPVISAYSVMEMLPVMKNDKKNEGDTVTLVLLERFGEPVIKKYTSEEILNAGI